MTDDIELSILIKKVNINFERLLNKKLSTMELTAAQCSILGYLFHNSSKEINMVDLEKKFDLKRPTISGIIKRLEEKDFINVSTRSSDKRYKKIVLQEKSIKLQNEMNYYFNEISQQLFNQIDDQDKQRLKYILESMLKNVSN